MLLVEIVCLVVAARFIDEQLTARMFSAYVALGSLVVFAVLVQRGLARSIPKPILARKLLYAAYLLAGVTLIALINCGPYHLFFNAAKPLAAGS